MTVLQNIIKKIKECTSEMKFKLNLKLFIQEHKNSIAEAEDCFNKAVEQGNAENAFYAWNRIKREKEYLQDRLDFEKYMLGSAA